MRNSPRPRRILGLQPLHKRRLCLRRRFASDGQSPCQGIRWPATILVQHTVARLLADDKYHALDRVAAVGVESDRIPRYEFDLAHNRIAADMDYFAEFVLSRRLFGGGDLCPASGKRGIGSLDRGAKKPDGNAVLPAGDLVVFEIQRARDKQGHGASAFPGRTRGAR